MSEYIGLNVIKLGQNIGNFQIIEKIGEGGMGEVYKAHDLVLKRDIAIKVLRRELSANKDLLQRFRHEAIILAKLNHHNVATLYGFLGAYSPFCMVMEFAHGETLLNYLKRHPRGIPFSLAMDLFDQILAGLQHAHARGIIHRDIKPTNIMVNSKQEIKVMDFGIGRVLEDQHLTRTGILVGTAKYMSPEQILGQNVDARSDVYALGVLVYEMLTGQIPFSGHSEYDLFKGHVELAPRTISEMLVGVPLEIETVIMRALSKKPGDRYRNAGEFRQNLNHALIKSANTFNKRDILDVFKRGDVSCMRKESGMSDDDKTVLMPVNNRLKRSGKNSTGLVYGLIMASIIFLLSPQYQTIFQNGKLEFELISKEKVGTNATREAKAEARDIGEPDRLRSLELGKLQRNTEPDIRESRPEKFVFF